MVTGGSSGIGRAIGSALADRGYEVVLVARGGDRLEQAARAIGGRPEVCDVQDRQAVEALAERVARRHAAVHVLVNNAGVPGRQGFLELDPERIEEVMRINYLGAVWCLRAFLPLLEAATPSHVVNVASVAGTVAGGPSGPYTASKFAQVAFSRTIAAELAGRGVRVHTVNPGFTHTEGFPQHDLLASPTLRRLVLRPERVADAVLYALALNRREVFVPASFRLFTALQGLAPATFVRLASRFAPRRYTRAR